MGCDLIGSMAITGILQLSPPPTKAVAYRHSGAFIFSKDRHFDLSGCEGLGVIAKIYYRAVWASAKSIALVSVELSQGIRQQQAFEGNQRHGLTLRAIVGAVMSNLGQVCSVGVAAIIHDQSP
jgi:hypothetical protein